MICAPRNEAANGPEKKGYEREEILPEEIDGKEEREKKKERERERDKEGKERGDARIEWASIEPRILPSTHTADGPALLNVFRGWLEILGPDGRKTTR